MDKIGLARIDDRLIHGQVMSSWLGYVGSKEIIIVDDELYSDEFTKSIILISTSKSINVSIYDIDGGVEFLKNTEKRNLLLLAKSPVTFYRMLQKGIEIGKINLGGMVAAKNRTKLYKNIAISEYERQILKKIMEMGVNIYIQIVPDEKAISLTSVLGR
ncbi:PTS sugar transporter subunit IIB [Laedolimicola ammoniilytica]|uniref:PTS sugar transporter subunit IIB n=1 Tax=Laedolimicola ammoniilytica TaxID=2981771 RepID=A0ABT2RX61_9FIRM|nr:PTS sugar transporter subunit IIB [Laedolimicola ammoniilytica]MCU6696832.1 PTS sugar transporter subunit IIB [Laedolimicola ammoniilytica]SCH95289.1 Sorbose-specific phosphotransferase enzyme IIB component [uncultured Clostridium sp.]